MKEKFKSTLPYVLILLVVILIKMFVFTTIKVNGISMYPTLYDKDIMIMDKIFYKKDGLKRFDIIVTKYNDTRLIKRVIGLPGETVEYRNNKLYINDKEVSDKYNGVNMDDFYIELANDEYYVMGDNRGDSLDSRIIGPIKEYKIMGKATITLYPFNRISGSK